MLSQGTPQSKDTRSLCFQFPLGAMPIVAIATRRPTSRLPVRWVAQCAR
jgi:hypothetical protein